MTGPEPPAGCVGPTPPAVSVGPTPPAVSVIVPVRDRRQLLRRCLDALAAQTLADHEVIVIDDGSVDGSAAEAEADAGAGRPVRLLRTPGIGAVGARRLGVEAARAPVLAFTDSDCVPSPRWLECGLGAIDGGAVVVTGPTWPAGHARPLERTLASDGRDGLYATCNIFFRRDAYSDAGGFDAGAGARFGFRPGRVLAGTGFGEDSLLAWRVRRRGGRVEVCEEAVVRHHVFPADPVESVRRAWAAGAFPALVREIPELRQTFLVGRFFLGGPWRTGLYLGVAAGLFGHRRLAGAGVVAWALWRGRMSLATEPSRRRALWSVPADLGVDALTGAALVVGSARHRSVVL
ncbi:MAG: glycosyltransferase [Acidimicrobiales bacterium]